LQRHSRAFRRMFQDLSNSDVAGLKNLRTAAGEILGGDPGVVRDVADVLSFEKSVRFSLR